MLRWFEVSSSFRRAISVCSFQFRYGLGHKRKGRDFTSNRRGSGPDKQIRAWFPDFPPKISHSDRPTESWREDAAGNPPRLLLLGEDLRTFFRRLMAR